MKKSYILFLFILLLSGINKSFAQKTSLYTEVGGVAPAVKIGVGHCFNERLSVKAGVGTFLLDAKFASWNLFASYVVSNTAKPFYWEINAGLLDNYYLFGDEDMVSIGVGIAPGCGYHFKNCSRLFCRLGWIAGPAWENGDREILSIPNWAIGYSFKICQ